MKKFATIVHLLVLVALAALAPARARAAEFPAGDAIRLEIPVLPGTLRYAELLEYPGYLAVVLENNGLSPSFSSKLQVEADGRSARIQNAVLRYTGHKEDLYTYEAAVEIGIGDSKISFPVTVDMSTAASGKVTVTLTPPLARLIPSELIDRIRTKTLLMANARAQQKVLDYLEHESKLHAPGSGMQRLIVAVLVDAHNRGGGPEGSGGRDVGDAVPLSDQWLLILTLVIWLLVVPVALLAYKLRLRRRRVA